jgi:hypothetical protein
VNLKQSYIETFLDNFELAHRQARSLAHSARRIGEMMPLSPSSSSVLGPRSSVLGPRSSVLSPQSSVLSPQSSVL